MHTFNLDQHWPIVSVRAPRPQERFAEVLRAVETELLDESDGAPRHLEQVVASLANEATSANKIAEPSQTEHSNDGLRTRALKFIKFLRGFDPKAAVWLSMGFVAGMAAWHAVGFWGFVSATVLKEPDRSVQAIASPEVAQPRAHFKSIITTGSITPVETATFSPKPAACVALISDRTTGLTSAMPCLADQLPLRDAGRRKRADRMAGIETRHQNAGSWTTETQPGADAPRDTNDRGTLSDADFDLTLTPNQKD